MTDTRQSIGSKLRELLSPILVYLQFAYVCFIRPLLPTHIDQDSQNVPLREQKTITQQGQKHQQKLENFYSQQAEIYDQTRTHLLKGREHMLKLSAGYLYNLLDQEKRRKHAGAQYKEWIWVDIGGGTGFNIETMNQFIDVQRTFSKVYLVDLTPSLCKQARTRFEKLGWKNVEVICDDAATWKPVQDSGSEIILTTFSYSLSMMPMPTVYRVIDHVNKLVSPSGIISVVDFIAEDKGTFPYSPTECDTEDSTSSSSYVSQPYVSYLARWFWQQWFEFDGVHLHPCRRDYLVHSGKGKTLKIYYGRNKWCGIPFIQIPYYIWMGAPATAVARREVEAMNKSEKTFFGSSPEELTTETKEFFPNAKEESDRLHQARASTFAIASRSADRSADSASISKARECSIWGHGWRKPYDPSCHELFSTYLYAFTWEDPLVDLKYMHLTEKDNVLCISSGGCNALEYLLDAPITVHCVDLNPCQNHLLELKLSAISALDHQELWQLFGRGQSASFLDTLDTRLSPYMSQHAYNYWYTHQHYFDSFYGHGGSGLCIRIFQWIIRLTRLSTYVKQMSEATDSQAQYAIWTKHVKPKLFHPWIVKMLNNPVFLWNALGVPQRQMEMLTSEGTAFEYLMGTLDPLVKEGGLLGKESFYYYMCLHLGYRDYGNGCCPGYLTPKGLETLKPRVENISIHTDTIASVCRKIADDPAAKKLTKAVIMDHMDWLDDRAALEEIHALNRAMDKGGEVYWRSASREPWYNKLFVKSGYNVELIHRRPPPHRAAQGPKELDCLDRINMYASFYRATKETDVKA